jgi:urease accessory protein UreF
MRRVVPVRGTRGLRKHHMVRNAALPSVVEHTLAAWFRQYCASLVSVGVRLIPLGQTQGQDLLARLGTTIIEAVECTVRQGIDEMTRFAPGRELAGIIHRDLLTTRLHIS